MTVQTADRDLRTTIARLELISHAKTQALDPTPRDTTNDPGGRRPTGSNHEHRPTNPEEHDDWQTSYQRKTVEYFTAHRRRVLTDLQNDHDDARASVRLNRLHNECVAVIHAWKHPPIVEGQPPALTDPNWKRWVTETDRDTGSIAREFNVSRSYIRRIKQMDWSTPPEPAGTTRPPR